MADKVAVILSGCGYMDGSEISEAVLSLLCLSQHKLEVEVFAPDMEFTAVDHVTGNLTAQIRNVISESTRITRGVTPLSQLHHQRYSALVMPGGFGVGKNLSHFSRDNKVTKPLPDVVRCIKDFHVNKKPIMAVCIAPALVSAVLANNEISLTLGTSDHNNMIMDTGNKFVACSANSLVYDELHRIITTPAFMCGTSLAEVFEGISSSVNKLHSLISYT